MKLKVEGRPGQVEDRYFDYRNVRVLDGQGEPYGVYCHASNVTERVLARERMIQDLLEASRLKAGEACRSSPSNANSIRS